MFQKEIPVISVVASPGTGKMTLLEKVIRELKRRGLKIALVKRDLHDYEIDHPVKDTWLHAYEDADMVAISVPGKYAVIEKRERELTLEEICARISGVDVILTEGYKTEKKPKIEVFRSGADQEQLLCKPYELIALASDIPWDIGVPCYHLDDYKGVANEIEQYVGAYGQG